ncbi:MAG: hypothetical protein ABR979_07775 [Halobacteriota archaeon]
MQLAVLLSTLIYRGEVANINYVGKLSRLFFWLVVVCIRCVTGVVQLLILVVLIIRHD